MFKHGSMKFNHEVFKGIGVEQGMKLQPIFFLPDTMYPEWFVLLSAATEVAESWFCHA